MKKIPNWICIKDKYARQTRKSDGPNRYAHGKCPVCGGDLVYLKDHAITHKTSTADWRRIALLVQGKVDKEKQRQNKRDRIYLAERPRQLKIMNIENKKRYEKHLDNLRVAAKLRASSDGAARPDANETS